MIYPEVEREALMEEAIKKNSATPDRTQDISPDLMTKQPRRSLKEDSDDDDDDEEDEEDDDNEFEEDDMFRDDGSAWTSRKAAASVLDYMALVYNQHLVPPILSALGPRLESEHWFVREAAILALGAICNGCRDALIQNQQAIQYIGNYLVNSSRSDNVCPFPPFSFLLFLCLFVESLAKNVPKEITKDGMTM